MKKTWTSPREGKQKVFGRCSLCLLHNSHICKHIRSRRYWCLRYFYCPPTSIQMCDLTVGISLYWQINNCQWIPFVSDDFCKGIHLKDSYLLSNSYKSNSCYKDKDSSLLELDLSSWWWNSLPFISFLPWREFQRRSNLNFFHLRIAFPPRIVCKKL